jgi:hypothetical protein
LERRSSAISAAGRSRLGDAYRPGPGSIRWSAAPASVIAHVDAIQPVSFWMDQRVLLRRLRVHFLLVPLAEVAVLSDDRDPLPGTPREHWLVWQSLTRSAVTTRVPADAGVLARRLGLGRGAHGAAARAMLGELMAAIWQLRSV